MPEAVRCERSASPLWCPGAGQGSASDVAASLERRQSVRQRRTDVRGVHIPAWHAT